MACLTLNGTKVVTIKKILLIPLLLISMTTFADRIKDLTNISGVRENHLLGYGLVIGLSNTGDRNIYTDQSLKSLLNKYSINVPGNRNLNASNVAAVMVEADLPAFAKPGEKIDVSVSSIGSARSLRNGTLVTTQLRGEDGSIYAVAQGSLIVSGVEARGLDGSQIHVNSSNVGTIPDGATVEKTVSTRFRTAPFFTYNLKDKSFTTSARIARAINKKFGAGTAVAIDARSIRVRAPRNPSERVTFISIVNNLDVLPAQNEPKVIVNSRSGTVVMTENVRVLPVAISEGNLVVNVSETEVASQPAPFSRRGETKIIKNSNVKIDRQQTPLKVLKTGPTLNDIVKALNDVGASPSDLVQVLELLKKAGALKADLIVI